MILRRLADAIREQNWFTVVLEILIVVVGIFIGLQVDDWNQARKDGLLERDYLARLVVDLDISLDLQQEILETAEGYFENSARVAEILTFHDLGELTESEFIEMFLRVGPFTSVTVQRTTLNELNSTGNLRLIRDQDIRDAIGNFIILLGVKEAIYANIHSASMDATMAINDTVPVGWEDGDRIIIGGFKSLFAKPLIRNYVIRKATWHKLIIEQHIQFMNSTLELRNTIAAKLGLPKIDGSDE